MSEPTPTRTARPQATAKPRPRPPPASPAAARPSQQDITALIDQAIKFRTAAHDLMHEAGELVKALKQHRRQSRAVQQTLDQIRTLKGLGV